MNAKNQIGPLSWFNSHFSTLLILFQFVELIEIDWNNLTIWILKIKRIYKILVASFLKRNLLKLKRLSIFFVFIILVSILFINYHHLENRSFQDNSLIFDTADDNSYFSTCDTYQVILIPRFISIIIIDKNLITPRILTCKFFSRAPPA